MEKWIEKLKCKVCAKYKDRIISAKSDQHVHAMKLQNMDEAQRKGTDKTVLMPIVEALNTLSEEQYKKIRRKFDTAYFIAIEQMAYQKYPKLCQLLLT